MHGLMMDYPLTIPAIVRRAQSLYGHRPVSGRRQDRRITRTSYAVVLDRVKRLSVALARLVLPSVKTIQVDWAQYGPKLAQVALTFGANELDRVSTVDDESLGRRRTSVEDVKRNIAAAGFTPVERT